MEATSHEHEIDIDKEIAKRAGNDDLAKCISVGNDEDLTVQKVSTIFGFTDSPIHECCELGPTILPSSDFNLNGIE